jgi:hypothetical protein
MTNSSKLLLAGILASAVETAHATSTTVQDRAHAAPATREGRAMATAKAAVPRPDPGGVDAPAPAAAKTNDLSASWMRYATFYRLAGGGG